MAGTPLIFETVDSQTYRKGYAGGDLTAEWVVWYETTLAAAEGLLWGTISNPLATGYGNLEVKSVQGRNLGAPDLWMFTVQYGSAAAAGAYRPDQLTVRVGTNTAHVTNSLATWNRLGISDMSQSGTNLTVDGTTNTSVLPDGYTPQPGDVGQTVYVTGGTGFTAGAYTVVSLVSPGGVLKWQLSASPAAVGTSGGAWNKPTTVGAGTDLTVDSVLDDYVAPDGWGVSSADVGRSIAIVGGTGFTPGVYLIETIYAGEWVLNESPAAAGTAGGTWYMLGKAQSFNGAIGVTRDTVAGCDIVIPACEFTLSQSVASMTDAVIRTCRAMVGKINAAPFHGYPTGTLLYLGFEPTSGEGSMANGQNFTFWNLAHRFKYEPDVTNVQIGGITLPLKPGHSYLWARYQPVAANNVLTVPPVAVYVEQVYAYGDFTTLPVT
jgi:hypothetical protein